MAALGLARQARRSRCPDGIAAQLLHAVIQTIDPSPCVRTGMGDALADPHEICPAQVEAADVGFKLASEARREMHDHVQVLPPIPHIVLAGPDPEAADPFATTPGGDAGSQTGEEVVEIAVRIGVEVDWVKVEGRPERAVDHRGETIGTAQVLALLGRDALRPCLAALIPLELGAALAPLPDNRRPNRLSRADTFDTYADTFDTYGRV